MFPNFHAYDMPKQTAVFSVQISGHHKTIALNVHA